MKWLDLKVTAKVSENPLLAKILSNIPKLIYHFKMNGRDVITKLKATGWKLDRIHGSHHIFVKDGRAVPVPVHGTRDLGAGLLAAIERQSGVKLK